MRRTSVNPQTQPEEASDIQPESQPHLLPEVSNENKEEKIYQNGESEQNHLEINEETKEYMPEKKKKMETDPLEPKEKEQRDISPASLGQSSKQSRRRQGDTVSFKDLLSGNGKPENEKSWMKVVKLSDDELAKLGEIKKKELSSSNIDKRKNDDNLVAELSKFFVTAKEQSKSVSDEIKEVTRVEMRHDLSKQQLFNTIIRSLYEEATWEIVHQDLSKREKLFKTFIRSTQDQVTFIGCWENFLNQHNTDLIAKAPLLFKEFYDKDYVEEESFLEWYDQANDTNEVKKKCTVFVNWLKEAEEEESE